MNVKGVNVRKFNIQLALELYATTMELTPRDIANLFGYSSKTCKSLKEMTEPVKEEMQKRKMMICNKNNVNTDIAFEVWDIDLNLLKRKYELQKKMGLVTGMKADDYKPEKQNKPDEPVENK